MTKCYRINSKVNQVFYSLAPISTPNIKVIALIVLKIPVDGRTDKPKAICTLSTFFEIGGMNIE